MNARSLVLLSCLTAALSAHAGHGLMNSFGGVEWLPDPGAIPGDLVYPGDRLGERIALRMTRSNDEEMTLSLRFAREKLAEASATIKAADADAARVAITLYGEYIDRAAASLGDTSAGDAPDHRDRFITALLEHVYIMSIEYLDMPLGVRTVLSPVFATAMAHYDEQSAKLSRGAKNALFFKEEEVRWSIEMTRQADEQKITN